MNEQEPVPVAVPPDCGHKEWTLGCPRCFQELTALAKGDAQVDTHAATLRGATLMCWHLMLLLRDFQAQLSVHTQSLDLQKVQVAKTLQTNLQQVEVHLTHLMTDEQRMTASLLEAARIAKITKEALDAERAAHGATPPQESPSGIVITG